MKKVSDIVLNTFRSILPPVITLIVSAYIISFSQASVWGEIVERILIIGLLNQIINWGHREYLIRAFSFEPANLPKRFINNLLTRSLLLIPAVIVLWIVFRAAEDLYYLTAWLIASFVYQSFDVLVVYHKMFKAQILAEITGLGILIIGLMTMAKKANPVVVFSLFFTLSLLFKSILLSLQFKEVIKSHRKLTLETNFFREALPFLLIGFSGMLVTKTDIYVIGLIAPENQLGEYQIVITFFIYLQALGSFIATPFLKQMYRVSESKFKSISLKFSVSGIALSILAIPFIYLLVEHFYGFTFPVELYLAGLMAIIPVYLYLPSILAKYRSGTEKQVIIINLLAAGISALATYFLYGLYELTGAVIAVAITQWALVVFYRGFSGGGGKVRLRMKV